MRLLPLPLSVSASLLELTRPPSFPPSALFAAQRHAHPAPIAPSSTEVSEEELSQSAKKLLPELGVGEDVLPSEEIRCVARLLAIPQQAPCLRARDVEPDAPSSYLSQPPRRPPERRVRPLVRHPRRPPRAGHPQRGRRQGGAGAQLVHLRGRDGSGPGLGSRRVAARGGGVRGGRTQLWSELSIFASLLSSRSLSSLRAAD